MADRQTTGGYPRMGNIISVDLPLLAQLKPGTMYRLRILRLKKRTIVHRKEVNMNLLKVHRFTKLSAGGKYHDYN